MELNANKAIPTHFQVVNENLNSLEIVISTLENFVVSLTGSTQPENPKDEIQQEPTFASCWHSLPTRIAASTNHIEKLHRELEAIIHGNTEK